MVVTRKGKIYPDLDSLMDFDHVIQVHEDRTISEPDGIHAPEVYCSDGHIDNDLALTGWSLLRGYSSQDHYPGPIMHESESIGGRLERDIRCEPGYYVAVVVRDMDRATEDETPDAGWAVAFKPANPVCAACSAQWFGFRDVECNRICASCGSSSIKE